mmetsp:Transcript_76904/g.223314  ORF Transcript_76904/g.223314 Transcript_76904/m.223314 type:complete len:137 (-) Transcript_76904:11-421(-)
MLPVACALLDDDIDTSTLAWLLGQAIPHTILLLALLGMRFSLSCAPGGCLCVASAVWILAAGALRLALASVCGVPCPVDCPLPAALFSHNALFHLMRGAGSVALALGFHRFCSMLERRGVGLERPASETEMVTLDL